MDRSLEELSKEIGSSINKRLPFVDPELFEEIVNEINQLNFIEPTMDSIEPEPIFYPEISNDQQSNEPENVKPPCTGNLPCNYCCQVDLFVVFGLMMISAVDTCFRFIHKMFRTIQNQHYNTIHTNLAAYHSETDTLPKIWKGLCTCIIMFLFVPVYIITGVLELSLKPISSGMCYQVHNMVFKCVSNTNRFR